MLLTVDELREFITTGLTDDALQILLDATERDIIAAAGDPVEQTEYVQGGYPALVLSRPMPAPDYGLISVTEASDSTSPVLLEEDDYRIDGYILHRLTTGTNPRTYWYGLVQVVFMPPDRDDERKRAQVALIQLDPSIGSDVVSEKIGEYSVSYGKGNTYAERYQAILESLRPLMVA
jgi:hypothetical protein